MDRGFRFIEKSVLKDNISTMKYTLQKGFLQSKTPATLQNFQKISELLKNLKTAYISSKNEVEAFGIFLDEFLNAKPRYSNHISDRF